MEDVNINSFIPPEVRYSETARTQLFGCNVNLARKDPQVQEVAPKISCITYSSEKISDDARKDFEEVRAIARCRKRTKETIVGDRAANNVENKELETKLVVRNDPNLDERRGNSFRRDESEETNARAVVELAYVDAWESARRDQSDLRCRAALQHLTDALEKCLVDERNEHRAAADIERFLRQSIDSYGRDIAYWQRRYERETEEYDAEICKMRGEIERRRGEVEELKDEEAAANGVPQPICNQRRWPYREKQKFVDDYLAEKEATRRRRARMEHARRSAIRVQAWWRGVMVRRKLGPYRPEERKKKRRAAKAKK